MTTSVGPGPVLSIIFEDAHIIAVNKPPNMFSVPVKSTENEQRSPRRFEQWAAAVRNATHFTANAFLISCIESLKNCTNIPRKERAFKDYMARTFKGLPAAEAEALWTAVCQSDAALHGVPLESIPPEKRSVYEILQSRRGEGTGNFSRTLYVVHRLDCETSGVLVFAKTATAASEMCRQFRCKETKKLYLAEVTRCPAKRVGVLDLPLEPHPDPAMKPRYVASSSGSQSAKDARTLIKTLRTTTTEAPIAEDHAEEEIPFSFREDQEICKERFFGDELDPHMMPSTFLMLEPVTGRSHQLRVHMQAIGCSILGDSLYAPPDVASVVPRLALHAYKLRFSHPTSGDTMELTAPIQKTAENEV